MNERSDFLGRHNLSFIQHPLSREYYIVYRVLV